MGELVVEEVSEVLVGHIQGLQPQRRRLLHFFEGINQRRQILRIRNLVLRQDHISDHLDI